MQSCPPSQCPTSPLVPCPDGEGQHGGHGTPSEVKEDEEEVEGDAFPVAENRSEDTSGSTLTAPHSTAELVEIMVERTSPFLPLHTTPHSPSPPPHPLVNRPSHDCSFPGTNERATPPLPAAPPPHLLISTPSRGCSSPGTNERGSLGATPPLPPIATNPELGILCETPLPSTITITSSHLPSRTDSPLHPLHKRVSFQSLQQDLEEFSRPLNKPRPLPPIGCDLHREEPLPPKSRRLPPLNYGLTDALSLYSGSSQSSQLFSHSGSTYSLPLPDPRYSTAPRGGTPAPFGGSQETHRSFTPSQRDGRKKHVGSNLV